VQRCGASSGYGCVKKDFTTMADALWQAGGAGERWLGAAAAESMAAPYCSEVDKSDCGMGLKAVGSQLTASAPCGSSFKLHIDQSTVNIVIVDACPHKSNEKWCPKNVGDRNSQNSYNHFDLWVGDYSAGMKELGNLNTTLGNLRKFEPIDTPPEIRKILQSYCCNTWWKGQGCPAICGNDFNYPPNCKRSSL